MIVSIFGGKLKKKKVSHKVTHVTREYKLKVHEN